MSYERALEKINDAVEKNLTVLDLCSYELTQLPTEIGKLTNLTTLYLLNNQFTQLPTEISKLTKLTTLVLNGNKLTQLLPEIGKLTNLAVLDLSNNELTQLPAEIGLLKNLVALNLGNNRLVRLPPEIGKLTNLVELNLYCNRLKQLPPEICNLTRLKKLHLSENQLTQLPSEIGQLTNLTILNLSHNQLTQLPPGIAFFTKLKQNEHLWDKSFNLKGNNFSLPDKVLDKKDPQEIIGHMLFDSCREGQIAHGELIVSIAIQRNLRKTEFAEISEWLKTFRIKAFFTVDKDAPDIKLPVKREATLSIIKQYLTNKLFIKHREGRITDGELFISIGTQRGLSKEELAKIKEWLNLFKITVFFGIDEERPDLELSEDNNDVLHQIKQYLSNKHQDHISQVYDQKTQAEK